MAHQVQKLLQQNHNIAVPLSSKGA